MRLPWLSLCACFSVWLTACGITKCGDESDITGDWTITVTPLAADAGTPVLPQAFTIDAQLAQQTTGAAFGIAHWVYGTLTASTPSVFGTLAIPQLMNNDGQKTGGIIGCTLHINIPIATPVTDDDTDQGPLRIALVGSITQKGQMVGDDGSQVILVSDSTNTPRVFAWTAVQNSGAAVDMR